MAYIVKTGSGSIRGMHEEGVLAFCGIPYPQPPIGPLRFRPPLKPLAWALSSVATPSCACCTVCPSRMWPHPSTTVVTT